MKKYFICVTAILLTMFSTSYAESIKVEGENFAYKNTQYAISDTEQNFSGKKYLKLQYKVKGNDSCEVTYDVDVPSAGYYDLILMSTSVESKWSSNFYVIINDGDRINAKRTAVSSDADYNLNGVMARLDMGGVYLNAGQNTVAFIVEKPRYADEEICFYLDYMEFIPSESYLRRIESVKPNGIFEKKDAVAFNFIMTAPSDSEKTITYSVTDYTGTQILSGEDIIDAGAMNKKVNIGIEEFGWYKINFEFENNSYSKTFAVIHNYSERNISETSPFGLDLVSQWSVQDFDDKKDYIRAAQLLGVSWIRDRFSWSAVEKINDTYSFLKHDDTINLISDAGLSLLEVFHDVPSWYDGNMMDVYDFMKTASANYKGRVDAWEIWNEPDIDFWKYTPEEYASFVKAAAIGIEDSESGAVKMGGGMCEYPVASDNFGSFSELALRNGILDYTDIYSYHMYGTELTTGELCLPESQYKNHMEASVRYGSGEKPVWVTEGGYAVKADSGTQLSETAQLKQARSNVINLTQSLAVGNDRHFWFMLPNEYESNGNQYGMMYPEGTPYISYPVYSNLTYQLGEATYKGSMKEVAGTKGYLFNNGMNDIAVLWGLTDSTYKIKNAEFVKVTDIMGNSRIVTGNNGVCSVSVSKNPIYVAFDKECSEENYFRENFSRSVSETETITEAERIVLRNTLGDDTLSDSQVKFDGYSVGENGLEIDIEVYNFGDSPAEVTVTAGTDSAFSLEATQKTVTVPAKSMETVSFKVSRTADDISSEGAYITFGGTCMGETISELVSRIHVDSSEVVLKSGGVFSNWSDTSLWTKNITSGAEFSIGFLEESGEMEFSVDFAGGDRWCYPWLEITEADASVMADMKGLCFWFYSETEVDNGKINAFISDGNLAANLISPYKLKQGYNRILIPFSRFKKSNINIEDIRKIAVGVNIYTDEPYTYRIKDLGYYNDGIGYTDANIQINGIADGEIIEDDRVVTVIMPSESDEKSYKIIFDGEIIESYTQNGKTITLSLSDVAYGRHTLYAEAVSVGGTIVCNSLQFTKNVDIIEKELLYRVEGEDYNSGDVNAVMPDNKWSNSGCIDVYYHNTSEKLPPYTVTYKICAPSDGTYDITLLTGYGDWFSPYTVKVNGVPYAPEFVENAFGIYGFHKITADLTAGENIIVFEVSELRKADSEYYCFHLDYFDVERYKYEKSETVVMEGESYINAKYGQKLTNSWNASTLDFSKLENGDGLKVESTSVLNKPEITYEIVAPKNGTYNLAFTSSPLDNTETYCNMYMTIGDNKYTLNSENVERTDDEKFSCDGLFYNYVFKNEIYLAEGKNTVTLTPVWPRTSDYKYYFYLDFMKFENVGSVEIKAWSDKNYIKEGESAQILVRGEEISSTLYESSNSEVAAIDYLGRITALKPGVAEMYVTVTGNETKEFIIPITVYDKTYGIAPISFSNNIFKAGQFSKTDNRTDVIVAVYNEDGTMVYVKSEDFNLKTGRTSEIAAEEHAGRVKAFMWSSGGMTPVFPSVEQ